MAMDVATLSTELQKIPNTDDEAVVRDGWRAAFDVYFAGSMVKGIAPVVTPYDPGPPEVQRSTPYDAALDQFALAMTGISLGATAIEGATKIQAAHAAFWTAIAPLVATVWVVVPVLASLVNPPPGVIAAPAYITALSGIFTASQVGSLSKADAYDAIATHMHTANLGANVLDTTVPTPLTLPVTPLV